MMDGGGFYDNKVFDVGKQIIAPLLLRKKICSVETIILSHPNSDHLNGLIYIAEHFNVKNFWSNNEPAKSAAYYQLIETLERKGINRPPFENLLQEFEINGVTLSILHPEKNFMEKSSDDNNNSIVLKVVYGSKSILFTGDIKKKSERELVKKAGNRLKSTVLIAPHHGSKSSSTAPFIRVVTPEAVVLSLGFQNRFGFPHPSVLRRYEKMGIKVYRTDLNGAVYVVTDGKTLSVTSEVVKE